MVLRRRFVALQHYCFVFLHSFCILASRCWADAISPAVPHAILKRGVSLITLLVAVVDTHDEQLSIRTVTDTQGAQDARIWQWSEVYLLNEGDSESIKALEHVIQGRYPHVQIHAAGTEEANKVLDNLRHCVRPSAKSEGGIGPGSVVWTTYNNRWWPARVLRPSESPLLLAHCPACVRLCVQCSVPVSRRA